MIKGSCEEHGPFLIPKSGERREILMGAGRKPKPTAMKELEGNPGKRKLNKKEPMPGKGMRDFN